MKKKCSTTRLSQKVYKRDFCSHVFANPDRGGGGGTRETSPAANSEEKRMFSQANPDKYVCMYITAFASISRTAFEIEALSFAVNDSERKQKNTQNTNNV